MDYKKSGVNIDNANILTKIIQDTVQSDNIGMFAGIYNHPYIPEYSLVGCTDGVGTKVIPLLERNLIETIAIDLVAMNVNDLICVGASPMFFLDYFATNSLDVEVTSRFIKALKNVLSEYNCTLLGGETAELKDLVTEGHFDVGGFCVGIVKKDKILRKDTVSKDDVVIGLKSSGPHSNGYTLIRKLHQTGALSLENFEKTLSPTHIYVKEILELCNQGLLKVCAHITGGGIEENLARVIPDHLCAEVFKENIPKSDLYKEISTIITEDEAYKTFNMGVGMCLVTASENVDKIMQICSKYEPFIFGRIIDEKNHRVRLR
jgi:phosphoribosylformylglycinamidine cyclo-ligase